MKMFLASSADQTLHFLEELVTDVGKEVLFVENAADPYEGQDRPWVTNDKKKFKELGYNLHEVDLRKTSPDELAEHIKANDILHICGGSVYYLLGLLKEKDFGDVIAKALQNEDIVYTATSAGSIIVSNNVKAFSYSEDIKEALEKVPDHKGLGLLNFCIVPHNNSSDSIPNHKEMVEKMVNDPTALFYIQDHQALWVDGEKMKLVEA